MNLFIVIDGIDGCGKSTISRMIKEKLSNSIILREPTYGKFGTKLRELLSSGNDPKKNAREIFDLFIKDRKENIEKNIKPALENGKIVICDRYKYSTYAYQIEQGISESEIVEKTKNTFSPSLTIILNVTPENAMNRIEKRLSKNNKQKAVFEKIEFLKKVGENFLKTKNIYKNENIKIINANNGLREVFFEVKKEVDKLILEK